jgi:hypothetical protein
LSAPPRSTDRSPAGPKAWVGSWQVAHASFPDADSDVSKNNARPKAAIALGEGGFSNEAA